MTKKIALGAAVAASALLWALPAAAQPQAAKATTVTVSAGSPTEFKFTVSKTSVPAGPVTFVVTNKGQLPHDFSIAGKKTTLLQAGKSAKLVVTLKKGKASYQCTVSGHAAAGMKGTITVK